MSDSLPEETAAVVESSDAALISRVREGDTTAYGQLYLRHVAAARGLARQLMSGEAEAEDAVSETFTKVLDLLRRGGGPQSGFRPYLLTAVRRTVYDKYRGDRRTTPTDEIEQYDPGVPFVDPALRGLEHSLIVRAFRSLPERWQAVLWHTEIETMKPADVAPLLGLTANGVAALGYRAREGLREAYLQMHIADGPRRECRPALDKLGAYVRGGLAKRDSALVERHLDTCADCKAIYAELTDVNTALRTAIGPLILGTSAAAYLAAVKGGTATGLLHWLGWFRRLPKHQQHALTGGTAVAAAAAVAAALLLVGDKTPIPPLRPRPPIAAPRPPAPKPRPKKHAPPVAAPPPAPVARPAKAAPPTPTPTPTVAAPALVAQIGTVGTLLRSQPGIVALAVRNDGAGRSHPVVADVGLPPGVDFLAASTGRTSARLLPLFAPGGGWTCVPYGGATASGSTVRCSHGALAPHAATSAYLHVTVGADAPLGAVPRVALRSTGARRTTARAVSGIRGGGLPARFATDGNVRTLQIGNALLSCDPHEPGCTAARARKGTRRDDDLWYMLPLDLDDDPSTRMSSSALLPLPGTTTPSPSPVPDSPRTTASSTGGTDGAEVGRDSDGAKGVKVGSGSDGTGGGGGQVLWAGLYWSGVDEGVAAPTVKLRGPGAAVYSTVQPKEVDRVRLPSYSVYQAYADVTAQVRQYGGGQWWAADVPTRMGPGAYAGWSLVVVVRDPSAPLQQVMVLDGSHAVQPEAAAWGIPVDGLLAAAAPARIGLVGWEGDADLPGDRLLVDGKALTPLGGDRDSGNVMDSSAAGAVGPRLTFGTNVDEFATVLGARQTLSLTTKEDAYLVGVVTVTAPMRS